MNLADLSIRRPVVAVMMIAALVVFGVLSYPKLGIDLWPKVEFPVVAVVVVYPGADPETMETKVADPIEEEINTLGGIRQLRSINLEGVTQVIAMFELEVDVAGALQDIRDRVARIENDLPDGIEPPIVQSFDMDAVPVISVAVSGDLGDRELTDVADDVVKARLQRIDGVGGVDVLGGRQREIQVLVDPNQLAGVGLTVTDLVGAIKAQNLEIPAGSIDVGAEQLTVKTRGEVRSAAEIGAILLPGTAVPLRVRDVAEVVDGMEEAESWASLDGQKVVSLVVRKQSGSNTVAVAEAVRVAVEELRPVVAAQGVTLAVPKDNSTFIAQSIHDVEFDLVFGGLLAIAIIYLMLMDMRATLISALALPTSVIATFAFVRVMGFTLNNLTTLALSLSIGILIDDAIVVIENIYRHLEQGKTAMQAAQDGTREIFLAVLAMTSSILAVFIPVATMQGMIGRFFYEFGLTVAFAVATSMLVSFTLTPMLASRFLKAVHGKRHNFVSRAVDAAMDATEGTYGRLVAWSLRHRLATLGVAAVALAGALVVAGQVPRELMPASDRSEFTINVETPTGTNLDATRDVVAKLAADLQQNAPGLKTVLASVGGGNQGQANKGTLDVALVPTSARDFSQEELMSWIRTRYAPFEAADVTLGETPLFGGTGQKTQQVQFNVRGDDLAELATVGEALAERMRADGHFVDVETSFRSGKPEISVEIDRERAASLGVSVAGIATTLRTLVAGDAVSELKDGADVFDITVRLNDEYRKNVAALPNLKVGARDGMGRPILVDLANVVRTDRAEGPSQIDREDRQRQVTIYANLEGMALEPGMDRVEALAKEVVPPTLQTSWSGMAEFMEEAFGDMNSALVLAILLVYMILASQFNSFVQPITIMLSLPLAVVGAFGALYLTGGTLSMLSMIGVIMLMGLVTKNAILLVDFANQRREQGLERDAALVEAGKLRLRPILMTTAAMVFGMLPVAIGLSEGGEMRSPMAVCVIGGLLTSTLLTLVVIPVVYALIDGVVESPAVRRIERLIFRSAAPAESGH